MNPPKSAEPIFPHISVVRDAYVMLDSALAALYGVTTKRLNEQVRRNRGRFPEDFIFQLTVAESEALRSQFATSSSHGGQRYQPGVFTEYGAMMAATILNSECRPAVGLSEPATEWDALGSQLVILKMVGGTTFRQAGQGV